MAALDPQPFYALTPPVLGLQGGGYRARNWLALITAGAL